MNLEELKRTLLKVAKDTHISVLANSDIATTSTWIKAPSYDLNRILSGSLHQGVMSKIFTVLVGPETSFKSSFTALCLAEAQRAGFTPIVIDTEGSWTKEFVTRWGLDPENILYIYTPWVENIQVILGKIIAGSDTKFALAIDSIGGIEALKLIDDAEKGDVKADQGTLQKKIKRMLKMVVNICKEKDSLAFAAAHYYGNPSGYGDPQQVGGGLYLKLAADIIIALKKSKMFDSDDKDVISGTSIKAITLKNRLHPPFNEAVVEIDYKKGINPYAGLLDIAISAGLIEQSGAWYEHKASGQKFQGAKKAEKVFVEIPNIIDEIDTWVRNTGYSTVNTNVKEAEELVSENK